MARPLCPRLKQQPATKMEFLEGILGRTSRARVCDTILVSESGKCQTAVTARSCSCAKAWFGPRRFLETDVEGRSEMKGLNPSRDYRDRNCLAQNRTPFLRQKVGRPSPLVTTSPTLDAHSSISFVISAYS